MNNSLVESAIYASRGKPHLFDDKHIIVPIPRIPNPEGELEELYAMMQYARPAFTPAEEAFIDRWIRPLGVQQDSFGNLFVFVGKEPTTLFSSHTDTVHKTSCIQNIGIVGGNLLARINKPGDTPECLGADDTSGVWIMRNMILNKIPGLYVFHRAEELGGVGSGFIAKENPGVLAHIKRAIAFDRRGYTSVVTQGPHIKCSYNFAECLSRSLNALGGAYRPDPTGVFTDTANYTHLIPECTNLSVGYHNAHTRNEHQHIGHLEWVCYASCRVKWDDLPVNRYPTTTERKSYGERQPAFYGYQGNRSFGGYNGRSNRQYERREHVDTHYAETRFPLIDKSSANKTVTHEYDKREFAKYDNLGYIQKMRLAAPYGGSNLPKIAKQWMVLKKTKTIAGLEYVYYSRDEERFENVTKLFKAHEENKRQTRETRGFRKEELEIESTAGLPSLVKKWPDVAAEVLEDFGVDEDYFREEVYARKGVIG